MKKVLVLGAGFVSGPCVRFLLKDPENQVFLADQAEKNVDAVLEGHSRGVKKVGNVVTQAKEWIEEIDPDLVVGLLPKALFFPVGKICIEKKKSFVLPSYASAEIKEMEKDMQAAGVSAFVELGVDPGIDHMGACKVIDEVHSKGGEVESYWSVCGSIPSQEANTNPMGYKMSWAPSSVIVTAKRDSKFLWNGKRVEYLDGDTFRHPSVEEIEGEGFFECYGNADSIVYADIYGIPEAKTIYRGTLRYLGWSETVIAMRKLGYFEEQELDLSGMTFAALTRKLAPVPAGKDLAEGVAAYLGVAPYSAVMLRLGWLGLLDEKPLPFPKGCTRDVLCQVFVDRMVYVPGEQDFVLMQHRFGINYPKSGKRERIYATLAERGTVGKETAIARTTGLPVAMGATMYLKGEYTKPGIIYPTIPEIYNPILKMLDKENIRMNEKVVAL